MFYEKINYIGCYKLVFGQSLSIVTYSNPIIFQIQEGIVDSLGIYISNYTLYKIFPYSSSILSCLTACCIIDVKNINDDAVITIVENKYQPVIISIVSKLETLFLNCYRHSKSGLKVLIIGPKSNIINRCLSRYLLRLGVLCVNIFDKCNYSPFIDDFYNIFGRPYIEIPEYISSYSFNYSSDIYTPDIQKRIEAITGHWIRSLDNLNESDIIDTNEQNLEDCLISAQTCNPWEALLRPLGASRLYFYETENSEVFYLDQIIYLLEKMIKSEKLYSLVSAIRLISTSKTNVLDLENEFDFIIYAGDEEDSVDCINYKKFCESNLFDTKNLNVYYINVNIPKSSNINNIDLIIKQKIDLLTSSKKGYVNNYIDMIISISDPFNLNMVNLYENMKSFNYFKLHSLNELPKFYYYDINGNLSLIKDEATIMSFLDNLIVIYVCSNNCEITKIIDFALIKKQNKKFDFWYIRDKLPQTDNSFIILY